VPPDSSVCGTPGHRRLDRRTHALTHMVTGCASLTFRRFGTVPSIRTGHTYQPIEGSIFRPACPVSRHDHFHDLTHQDTVSSNPASAEIGAALGRIRRRRGASRDSSTPLRHGELGSERDEIDVGTRPTLAEVPLIFLSFVTPPLSALGLRRMYRMHQEERGFCRYLLCGLVGPQTARRSTQSHLKSSHGWKSVWSRGTE
jgi:hypothetical protein